MPNKIETRLVLPHDIVEADSNAVFARFLSKEDTLAYFASDKPEAERYPGEALVFYDKIPWVYSRITK